MSKAMADLLKSPEAGLSKAVSKFEELTGYPSEDVRLLVENKQKVRSKTSELGLDPDDTTNRELYHALITRFDKDSSLIDKAVGVSQNTGVDERIDKAIQLVKHCAQVDEMWVVKNSKAKDVLSNNPPKQTAKIVNYRSIVSFLKREDIAEIFLVSTIAESVTWQRNITKQISKLNSTDFELRPIKIAKLPFGKWPVIKKPTDIIKNSNIGALAIWPSPDLDDARVLSLTLLLLRGLQRLNPNGYSESLSELSPSLRWWAGTDYLIAEGENPVSFSLKDVAYNHQKKYELENSASRHGSYSFWHELINRYKARLGSQESDSIPDMNNSFIIGHNSGLPNGGELAAEYVEVN